MWAQRLAIAGLVTTLLYSGPVARNRPLVPGQKCQIRIYGGRQCAARARPSSWRPTGLATGRTNAGTSPRPNSSRCRINQEGLEELTEPVTIKGSCRRWRDAFADRRRSMRYLSSQVKVEYFDIDAAPLEAQNTRSSITAPSCLSTRAAPNAHPERRAVLTNAIIKSWPARPRRSPSWKSTANATRAAAIRAA